MSRVMLRYEPEDEHHGELFVTGTADGYSGHSSAWFNRTSIEAFSQSLRQYPLPAMSSPKLAGGEMTGEGALKHVWAGIEIRPWNSTGTLVVLIQLGWNRRPVGDWRQRGATFDFLTDYSALDPFQNQLEAMLAGTRQDAVLSGFDG